MITSRNNPEIIETEKLKHKKYRNERQAFLIDGTKLLKEALNSGFPILKVFCTQQWMDKHPDLAGKVKTIPVIKKVLDKLSSVKISEGVVSVVQKPGPKIISQNQIIFLDNISDPGNLGSIIRTADAAGFKNVICSENCVDIYNEKVLRASMGSVFHINVSEITDTKDYMENLKDLNYRIYGTSLDGNLFDLRTFKAPQRYCIIFGNEANGISPETLEYCSDKIKIPIKGEAESLNVSVAAGIIMYGFSD